MISWATRHINYGFSCKFCIQKPNFTSNPSGRILRLVAWARSSFCGFVWANLRLTCLLADESLNACKSHVIMAHGKLTSRSRKAKKFCCGMSESVRALHAIDVSTTIVGKLWRRRGRQSLSAALVGLRWERIEGRDDFMGVWTLMKIG